MNEFEHELEARLAEAASRLTPQSTHVGAILSAGAERSKRRQARLALAGLVGVAAIVGGSVAVLTRDHGHHVRAGLGSATDQPDDSQAILDTGPAVVPTLAAPGGGANVVPSPLTWRTIDLDSTQALGYNSFGPGPIGTGPFFAVSTAPGKAADGPPMQGSMPMDYYRSTDGQSWSTIAPPPEMALRGLTASGANVYAVGSAAATAALTDHKVGDVVVASSTDAGDSWNSSVLPIDLRALDHEPGYRLAVGFPLVAAGPDGPLVVVQPYRYLDLSAVNLGGIDSSGGWYQDGSGTIIVNGTRPVDCSALGATPTTVAVDAAGNVVTVPGPTAPGQDNGAPTTTSLAPVGSDPTIVAPTTLPAVSSTIARMTATTASPVGAPGSPSGCMESFETGRFTPTQLGISPTGGDPLPIQVFASGGAGGFTAVGEIPPAAPGLRRFPSSLVRTPGGWAVFGIDSSANYESSSGWMATSTDGAIWTEHLLSGVTGMNSAFVAGGRLVVDAYGPAGELMLVSDDGGGSWRDLGLATAIAESTGTAGVEPGSWGSAGLAVDASGITAIGFAGPAGQAVVAHTSDFATWSVEPLADLAPGEDGLSPVRVQAVDGQVVITALAGPPSPTELHRQVAIVGTPTG